jgi:Protein of unknown function (DUF3306)
MADDSGFLGRWSRRKLTAKEGKPLAPEPPVAPPVASAAPAAPASIVAAPVQAEAAKPPAPTLEDAQALTPQSDFKPFMTQGVAPEVKNAAMRKLFADPQFNVMDGLDIYIDDYAKPDPIPASMLRQMASAKFLKMFDEEEEETGKKVADATVSPREAGLGDDADAPAAGTVAQSNLCKPLQSQPASPAPHASQPPDADPDLRLQPDDAPAGQKPGHRTG